MEVVVKNLVKHFGSTQAVDDLSFSFSGGNVFGFVGPNGAGKTTTIRILATLLEPSAGDAYIEGYSVIEDPEKVRTRLGYMPDTLPTHSDMTVRDYVDFYARASGVSAKRRNVVVEGVEEFTRLTGIRQKFLKDLSKGMKQRVSLARALVHDPAVLILDEPAAGLDPRARIELRELLKALAEQGKAILISSHILSELAEICDGAVIIEQGKLLRAGGIAELQQTVAGSEKGRVITIRSEDGARETLYKFLIQQPMVEEAVVNADDVQIEFSGNDTEVAALLRKSIEDGLPIVDFHQERTNLEDVFMKITRGGVQ